MWARVDASGSRITTKNQALPHGYIALGWMLFLQEQIKDIIIIMDSPYDAGPADPGNILEFWRLAESAPRELRETVPGMSNLEVCCSMVAPERRMTRGGLLWARNVCQEKKGKKGA